MMYSIIKFYRLLDVLIALDWSSNGLLLRTVSMDFLFDVFSSPSGFVDLWLTSVFSKVSLPQGSLCSDVILSPLGDTNPVKLLPFGDFRTDLQYTTGDPSLWSGIGAELQVPITGGSVKKQKTRYSIIQYTKLLTYVLHVYTVITY